MNKSIMHNILHKSKKNQLNKCIHYGNTLIYDTLYPNKLPHISIIINARELLFVASCRSWKIRWGSIENTISLNGVPSEIFTKNWFLADYMVKNSFLWISQLELTLEQRYSQWTPSSFSLSTRCNKLQLSNINSYGDMGSFIGI